MSFSYLALGDSYTIGEGLNPDSSFPVILSKRIQKKYNDYFQPEIIAKTGWTTTDLLENLSIHPSRMQSYSFSTLLIGVNNQYQGKPFSLFIEEYKRLCAYLLSKVENKPQNVIALSIPDYSVTPYSFKLDQEKIAKEISIYNKAIEEMAGIFRFHYVNITGISQLAKKKSNLLVEDLLHPSKEMYEMWVEKILDEIPVTSFI